MGNETLEGVAGNVPKRLLRRAVCPNAQVVVDNIPTRSLLGIRDRQGQHKVSFAEFFFDLFLSLSSPIFAHAGLG